MSYKDPEKKREYMRRYRIENAERLRRYNFEYRKRKNIPEVSLKKGVFGSFAEWLDAAYSTGNRYAEEISWGIDKEKLKRNMEE